MASPQVDNGEYTRIANDIIEHLVSSGLNGTELAVVFLVIRKTYGWNKKEDQISLSQFTNSIPVSKKAICTALRNLQLVKIITLVKKGNSKIQSNLYSLNKDYDKWQLVKKSKLVKKTPSTSEVFVHQLVKKTTHTKDTLTKDNIQKTIHTPKNKMIDFINSFNSLDDNYQGILTYLEDKKIPRSISESEIAKFINYWTELNSSGTKQRWQLEKTFEVQRRLVTWFNNANKFNKQPQKKGIRL